MSENKDNAMLYQCFDYGERNELNYGFRFHPRPESNYYKQLQKQSHWSKYSFIKDLYIKRD